MFQSFHHSESVLERNAGTAETPSVEETLVQVPTITAHIEQYFLTEIGQAFRPVGRRGQRYREVRDRMSRARAFYPRTASF